MDAIPMIANYQMQFQIFGVDQFASITKQQGGIVEKVCGFAKKLKSSFASPSLGELKNNPASVRCFVDGGNLRVPPESDERNEYKIWVYYQNVRGLRTKIDELFLAVCDCNYDIIILTETGLDDRINSQQLFGNAFNVFRCDRSLANSVKSKFGGVLVAVSQKYASTVVQTVNGRCLEQVCVCATVRDRKIFLCGVYIPPDKSQQVGVIDEHISTVSELCSKSSASDIVFVCGDFYQPRITWGHGSDETQSPSSLLPAASTTLIDVPTTTMADYFEELGCEPISTEQTEHHQLMLMVRFLQQNGFFSDDFSTDSLPPPASKQLVANLPEKQIFKDDERCTICIKPNEEVNEIFLVLPCKHNFHKSCIMPWLEKTNSCPLCRYELKTDDESYEEQKKFRERAARREQDIEELHNSMYG
ncbi:uncharacterized protein LOC131427487 [Malaya genurostris]|uniref:uncharacterized protein LOC131427487 n=1 Tax=Malaya genurostris TaxID=325434 RepID=UPI0026F3B210|nr:uncharacterized protein LOC131427487 [Malaya genurostris]